MKHSRSGKNLKLPILERALKLLEKDGILKKTRGIYLCITKSDKFPAGTDNNEAASAFIERDFGSLKLLLKRVAKEYGFKVALINFSLGEFISKDYFKYDPISSAEIYESIINLCFSVKSKSKNHFMDLFK